MEMSLHPFVFDRVTVPGEHGSVTIWRKMHRFEDLDGRGKLSLMLRAYVAF